MSPPQLQVAACNSSDRQHVYFELFESDVLRSGGWHIAEKFSVKTEQLHCDAGINRPFSTFYFVFNFRFDLNPLELNGTQSDQSFTIHIN